MTIFEEHSFNYTNNNKQKTTFYLAAGPVDGPLLMFIHGWPAIGKLWKPQLEVFAGLGFRVVAPDMPGYGKSSAPKDDTSDYSLENINLGMLALLKDVGRDEAVWIGHDWGCGAVWSFAAHYPEKCTAVACLTVPYRTIELGLDNLVRVGINRDTYPEKEFPYGQWDYQHFYETNFEDAHKFFDNNIPGVMNLLYSKGNPAGYNQRAFTAMVSKEGGWFGGVKELDPKAAQRPLDQTVLDKEMYDELVAAMQRTGFFGADAWYANHAANRKYTLEQWKNEGEMSMPVLFIHARFDVVCATTTTRICEPMRTHCQDLTEVSVDAGHWVAEEKPAEMSAAIARWLVEKVKTSWPGYWANGHVWNKL